MTLRSLAVIGGLLWAGTAWAGPAGQESLRWSELGPRIEDKKVALVLPDGTQIQGKVRAVESTGLRLDISKTSNKKVQPKGRYSIPRSSVSFLRVTEYRTLGRILITAGAVTAAGLAVAAGASDNTYSEGDLAVIIPLVATVGVAGVGIGAYHFGKAVDKRITEIRVLPGD